jgi:oxygen-independent coproporphyrinogen-3 oxidase
MSALPGQSFETWADSLRQAVQWGPEHISAYSLIIEPGTSFSQLYEAGKLPPLPDEETDRKMYHFTRDFLAQYGYGRYEIVGTDGVTRKGRLRLIAKKFL